MKKILITVLFILLFSFTFACAQDVSTSDGTKPSDETLVEQTDSGDYPTGQTGSDVNPNAPTDSDDSSTGQTGSDVNPNAPTDSDDSSTGENNGCSLPKDVELPEIPL